jgi:hypothetical protein
MDPRRLILPAAVAAALVVGAFGGAWLGHPAEAPAPDPMALASNALLSVRDAGRVVSYTARYTAVVTSEESRLGLTAKKTLILPGTVRYGVDLTRLRRADLAWDAPTRTLSVTLPPLEISGPTLDLTAVQEYSDGGLLMALSDAGHTLDEANRLSAAAELMRQARDAAPMQAAHTAAMRDAARSFALPLRAAGVEASVAVRFVDASGREEAAFLDRPRRLEQSLNDRQAGR